MKTKMLKIEMAADPANPKIADINIYDYVGSPFRDEEDGSNISTASKFQAELKKLGDVSEIRLHVNSQGGLCSEGISIYSQLLNHTAKKTAYIEGFACSIAGVIVCACDNVIMSPASQFQMHPARGISYGNADNFRQYAAELDSITDGVKSAYLGKSGGKLTAEKLDELMQGVDGDGTFLTAQQAMDYGLCDQISGKSAKPQNPEEPEPDPDTGSQNNAQNNEFVMNMFKMFF